MGDGLVDLASNYVQRFEMVCAAAVDLEYDPTKIDDIPTQDLNQLITDFNDFLRARGIKLTPIPNSPTKITEDKRFVVGQLYLHYRGIQGFLKLYR